MKVWQDLNFPSFNNIFFGSGFTIHNSYLGRTRSKQRYVPKNNVIYICPCWMFVKAERCTMHNHALPLEPEDYLIPAQCHSSVLIELLTYPVTSLSLWSKSWRGTLDKIKSLESQGVASLVQLSHSSLNLTFECGQLHDIFSLLRQTLHSSCEIKILSIAEIDFDPPYVKRALFLQKYQL